MCFCACHEGVWGNGGIAPCIINIGVRPELASFKARPPYPQGNIAWQPREGGWTEAGMDAHKNNKIPRPLSGSDRRAGRLDGSIVAIPVFFYVGTVLRHIQWPSIHNPSPPTSVHFNTPSAHPRRHRTPNSRDAWQTTGAIKRSNSTITDLDIHPFLWRLMVKCNDQTWEQQWWMCRRLWLSSEGSHTHAKYVYTWNACQQHHKTSMNAPLLLTESTDNVHKTWWEHKGEVSLNLRYLLIPYHEQKRRHGSPVNAVSGSSNSLACPT